MTSRPIATTPEAKFRQALEARLREQARPRAFVVPQLSADPPETDATNLWMRNDGRLRGRYRNSSGVMVYIDYPLRSDITSPPAIPANPAAPSPGPVPQSYQTVWTGTWSQTYFVASGAKRVDSVGETSLVYGKSPEDALAAQRALVGFDSASLVSVLTGSTIQSIQLTMTNLGSYWPTVQVSFGMHNSATEPATLATADIQSRMAASGGFGVGPTTIDLPMAFAQALRAGTAKGIAVEAPSEERTFYGYAAGVGSGYTAPQLTITYAK